MQQESVSGTEDTATAHKYYHRYTVVHKQLTGADKQHNGIRRCLVRSKRRILVHAYYVTCNCGFRYRLAGHSAAVAALLLTSSVRVAHNLGPQSGTWTLQLFCTSFIFIIFYYYFISHGPCELLSGTHVRWI